MKEVALHQKGTACLLREHEQWQLRAIAVSRHENNQEEKIPNVFVYVQLNYKQG